MEVKPRVLMLSFCALFASAALLAIGGYVGYDVGIKTGVQDAYFCSALNTKTYLSLLRGLDKEEPAATKRLLEVSVNMGVLMMSNGQEQNILAERTSESVQDALSLVKRYRDEHPWSSSNQEIDSRVAKALVSRQK